MQVQELARQLSVTPETVRYYTRIGLLTPRKNLTNGYRDYGSEELRRLRFCVRARQLGFSLSDIRNFLNTADAGNEPCDHVREIMQKNLKDMEHSLMEAQRLFQRMQDAMVAWDRLPECRSDSRTICRLIESWDREMQMKEQP